jgi:hypothetical protein
MSPTTFCVSSVKVSFNGQLRRFPFPIDQSADQFAVISQTVAQSFAIAPGSLVLQYVDDENDTITIGSQLELTAAIATATTSILRLTVAPITAAAVPARSLFGTPLAATAQPYHPDPIATTATPGASWPFGCGGGRGGSWGGRGFWSGRGGSWGGRRCGRKSGDNLQEQYKSQLAELEREGLNYGWWAIRILANLNGDVEAAKHVIRTRKAAMNGLRAKYAKQLDALQAMGLIPAAPAGADQQQQDVGGCGRGNPEQAAYNHCTRKCIRLLERFDGNAEQVAAHIRQKQAERESLPIRYATQMTQLREQGFWCEPVCLRLLHKFDGDVAKVAECMSKFRKHHASAQHNEHTATATANNSNDDAATQYPEQLRALTSKGYSRWSSARLLRKFDGDASRVERALDARKQWFSSNVQQAGMYEKRQEFKQAKMRYAAEIKQLKEMGFRCKWLLVPLLVQHNGDVSAVSLALA